MTSNTIINVQSIQSKMMNDFKSELENFFDEAVSQLESKMENGVGCYNQYYRKIQDLLSKQENCINYDNPDTSYVLTVVRKILLSEQTEFSHYEFFYEDGDVSQLIASLNLRYDSFVYDDIKRYIKNNMDIESFINDYFPDSFDFFEMENHILKNENKLYRIEKILKRKLFEKERKQSIDLKKKEIENLKLKIEELEKELISIRENLL